MKKKRSPYCLSFIGERLGNNSFQIKQLPSFYDALQLLHLREIPPEYQVFPLRKITSLDFHYQENQDNKDFSMVIDLQKHAILMDERDSGSEKLLSYFLIKEDNKVSFLQWLPEKSNALKRRE